MRFTPLPRFPYSGSPGAAFSIRRIVFYMLVAALLMNVLLGRLSPLT